MNYLHQINGYWKKILNEGQLSLSAGQVYFALLDRNNAFYWKTEFTITPDTIMNMVSISKNTYYKALAELNDRGFIEFKRSENRSLLGKIKIIPLYQNLVHEVVHEVVHESDTGLDTSITLNKPINPKTYKPINGGIAFSGLEKAQSKINRRKQQRQNGTRS